MIDIIYGLICGAALGLTGGGGSILAVPMLMYLVGLPFHKAVTVSLIVMGLTSLYGLLLKLKNSDVVLSAGIILAISGMIFAPVGSIISRHLNANQLSVCFALLMLGIAALTWLKSTKPQPVSSSATEFTTTRKSTLALLGTGVVTGLLTGIFGVGGGFIIVPALMLTVRMPIKNAIATSMLIIFLVSISGLVAHISQTKVPWTIAGYFIIGGAIGMTAATAIKDKLDSKMLQKIFAVMLLCLGIFMLAKHLTH